MTVNSTDSCVKDRVLRVLECVATFMHLRIVVFDSNYNMIDPGTARASRVN